MPGDVRRKSQSDIGYPGSITTAMLAALAVSDYAHAEGTTGSPTQASGVAADLPEMTVTQTLIGSGIQFVMFEIVFSNSAAGAVTSFTLLINGVSKVTRDMTSTAANERKQLFILFPLPSVAGSTTSKIQWLVSGGTATAIGIVRSITSLELKR